MATEVTSNPGLDVHALTFRDLAGVREAAYSISESCLVTGTPWNEAALIPLSRVMRAEVVGHHKMARTEKGWTAEVVAYPRSASVDGVPDVLEEHPLVRHYRSHPDDAKTLRLSTFYSDSELRQSALFRKILKPMGTPRFMGIPSYFTSTTGDGFGLSRSGRDFSEREEAVGDALHSLLAALRHQSARSGRLARGFADQGGLTQRERDVAELLARGLTAYSIGRALGIRERTVHKHLQNVYRKLGVHDRLSAVRLLDPQRTADRK